MVSYDPNLDIQCLSIKDSVNKFNTTLINDVVSDHTLIAAECKLDMATVFFGAVFGGQLAQRVMSGIIAFSVFGNVTVMTFTASRGKKSPAQYLPRNQWRLIFWDQSNRKLPKKAYYHSPSFSPAASLPLGGSSENAWENVSGQDMTTYPNRVLLRHYCSIGLSP